VQDRPAAAPAKTDAYLSQRLDVGDNEQLLDEVYATDGGGLCAI
jgi:hypothetical protein